MELLVGAAYRTAKLEGDLGNAAVSQQLADLVVSLEATRALLRLSELQPSVGETGMALPSTHLLQIAITHGVQMYYDMLLVVRDLAGASVTTHQTYEDLTSPEIGQFVEECFGGKAMAEERLGLFNLIQDLAASHFAARQDQFSRFSAGTPTAKKLALAQGYDFQPLLDKVDRILLDARSDVVPLNG
jgi:4-hydroxyphenylacetate 3-monooxygenase